MENQILVAVDPFAYDQVNLKKAGETVRHFAEFLHASIEPVAVISPDQVQWPGQFDGTWSRQLEIAGKKNLEKVVKSAGLSTENIEVVVQETHSTKASAEAITHFASEREFGAIVAFTHYRKAPHFKLFGSFATALLEKSKMPILFVNAVGKPVRSFHKILVATDFSPENELAFKRTLEWASRLKAEILIFHALTEIRPATYASVGVVGIYSNFEKFVREEESKANANGERWIKMANDSGCRASFVLRHTDEGVAESALKCAQEHSSDMISICSKTHGATALFIGSVTRNLLEISTLPVFAVPSQMADATTGVSATSKAQKETSVVPAQ